MAVKAFKLRGMNKVVQNLNKEIQKIEKRSMKGLIRAAIIVQRDCEKNLPKTPVDLGNLRSSFFTVTSYGDIYTAPGGEWKKGYSAEFENKKGSKVKIAEKMESDHKKEIAISSNAVRGKMPVIVLGFSAYYAIYVHENIGATFQRPGAGAKFFEVALDRNEQEILDVIKKEVQIK